MAHSSACKVDAPVVMRLLYVQSIPSSDCWLAEPPVKIAAVSFWLAMERKLSLALLSVDGIEKSN